MASHRNEFSIPFLDTAGKLRYTLACKGGATEFTDRLANQSGMQFPGTLTCVLNEGNAIVEGSLLAEDGVAIWHTRGAWWESHTLLGKCGEYPEFGRVRHFRLRGFLLTLKAEDIEAQGGELKFFTLAISVKRDPSATSGVAESPGYIAPKNQQCDIVQRGKEPRSCRNRDGSWQPCPPGRNSLF